MLGWLTKKRDASIRREATEKAVGAFMDRYGTRIKASYDAAADDAEFANWWSNADNYGAKRANSLAVRRKLRQRARYEYFNNPFCKGIIDTRANDTIGRGPRLQLQARGIDQESLTRIEEGWSAWCRKNKLAEKLRTMVKALGYDGEPFGVMTSDDSRPYDVTLGLRLVECDQFTDPVAESLLTNNLVDGIRLGGDGEPRTYRMTKYHPGNDDYYSAVGYDDLPASQVIHLFRCDRAGQYRGIPDITPALTLFAALRRYRNAVLGAAETAASFAVFFKTQQYGGFDDTVTPFASMEIQQKLGIYLPAGWDSEQMKAEQPTTTYEMFVRVILMEICRSINMPYTKAAGYTADYSYASGKIEERDYESDLSVDRDWIGLQVVDRLYEAWWNEAVATSIRNRMIGDGFDEIIPQSLWDTNPLSHSWMWDKQEHLDPSKAANAIATKLQCGATTLPLVYAEVGLDAEVEISRGAEFFGMDVVTYKQRLADQQFSDSLSIAQQGSSSTREAARTARGADDED